MEVLQYSVVGSFLRAESSSESKGISADPSRSTVDAPIGGAAAFWTKASIVGARYPQTKPASRIIWQLGVAIALVNRQIEARRHYFFNLLVGGATIRTGATNCISTSLLGAPLFGKAPVFGPAPLYGGLRYTRIGVVTFGSLFRNAERIVSTHVVHI